MNQEIKKQWVEALRSGKYEQGKGALNHDGKFCCLGVLCDIYSKEKGIQWDYNARTTPSIHGVCALLPEEVIEYAKLSDKNPPVSINGFFSPLAHLNDLGKTFLEIADAIEKSNL